MIWQTTNPYNLKHFEVERSYDGIQFSNAGIVNALQNPAAIQDYSFNDPIRAKAVNFYRLKMVDNDNRFKYSGIIKLNNNQPEKFVELLQNPVTNNITLIIDNQQGDKVSAVLYNSSGQQMQTWQLGSRQGTISLPVDRLGLSSGIYIFKVMVGNRTESILETIH